MSKKLFPLLVIAALSLGGCTHLFPSGLDDNWGQSVTQNTEQQIANPEGSGLENDPGASSDGGTTSKDMQRLRTRQTQQPATGGSVSIIDNLDD
jgi:hypothetical protein